MAYARLYPTPTKGGRGKKSPLSGDLSQQYLSRARAVLTFPDLADQVASGARKDQAASFPPFLIFSIQLTFVVFLAGSFFARCGSPLVPTALPPWGPDLRFALAMR